MKIIYTKKGEKIIVDDENYEELNKHNWYANRAGGTFYARRDLPNQKGVRASTLMHRVIMCAQQGQQIDHMNGNGLDNRTDNLRVCTKAENAMNQGPQKHNTSGYKGVTRPKSGGKWTAQITIYGQHKYLGCYRIKEDAARAYDKAAIKYHGEFARLNFPKENRAIEQDAMREMFGDDADFLPDNMGCK